MPQRSYNDPLLVAKRKEKKKLKAKQFMTSDVAYTGKKKIINQSFPKRKGKRSKYGAGKRK
mgnify:CR=1 FL=1